MNRIIRAYWAAGATGPLAACSPEMLGCRRNWRFERMIDRGVFVPIADGRCYLDVDAARSYLTRRRMRIILVAMIAVFIAIISASA